jgi:hypothetical protein
MLRMMSKTEMRPIKDTIPLAEACAIIDETFRPLDRWERVPLLEADRRVVAEEVRSPRDVPPFARAAMDGFAVRAEDTFGASQLEPRTLRVLEKVYTGQVPTTRVSGGTCVEIATGAPMPDGADAVVMVEETERATECSRPCIRARTWAARAPTSYGTRSSCAWGMSSTRAESARSPRWAHSTWRCSPGRPSRFSQPAMKSWTRVEI